MKHGGKRPGAGRPAESGRESIAGCGLAALGIPLAGLLNWIASTSAVNRARATKSGDWFNVGLGVVGTCDLHNHKGLKSCVAAKRVSSINLTAYHAVPVRGLIHPQVIDFGRTRVF